MCVCVFIIVDNILYITIIDGWMEEWVGYEWMAGWTDGWMDGWTLHMYYIFYYITVLTEVSINNVSVLFF